MMNQSQWYYGRGGVQSGPVPLVTLRDMLSSGQLALDDLVWSEGMPQWLPIRQVPALQSILGAGPAPTTTPPPPATYAQPQYGAAPDPRAYVQPAMQAPPGQQYAAPNYGYQQPYVAQSHNGMAIAGFVMSLFPAVTWLGLIFCIIALNGMKRTGNPEGKGLAIAGVVISILELCLFCLWIGIVAAVANGFH